MADLPRRINRRDLSKIQSGHFRLYDAIMDSMKKEHAKSDLSGLEKLQGVALLTSPWTPENGCLTAANKLQRRAVVQQFEKDFLEVKKKGIFK